MLNIKSATRSRTPEGSGEAHLSGRVDVCDVRVAFDEIDVLHGIDFDVAPGEIVALLGPSGCGKTTLLRSIAGLERIDSGMISLNGREVASPRYHMRPEARNIGLVFQDWALFPHMTVADNVAYGLARRGKADEQVAEVLALVGLDGLGHRMPATLSGGQQQRVALARALAPQPSLLLLDEPFSNLDTGLRVQVRAEVHSLLTSLGVSAVFVTHDQEEAFVLGDRVAIMREGRVEQFDSPAAIYEHPSSAWVAEFVGDANFLRGVAHGMSALTPIGPVPLSQSFDGEVDVLLRPEHVSVTENESGNGVVSNVEYFGHDHMVQVDLDSGGRVAARISGNPRVRRGQRVVLASDGSACLAFSAS
jgi:iron(III) transport system ATP-binding protein